MKNNTVVINSTCSCKKKYTRNCPECNKEIKYDVYGHFFYARKINSLCEECKLKNLPPVTIFNRNCSKCGKEMIYRNKLALSLANRNKSKCPNCRAIRVHSQEENENMSIKLKEFYKTEKGKELIKKNKDLFTNKTYEEMHGEEKAKKIKEKISNSSKGEKNGFYGKTHSAEIRKFISENNKGKATGDKNPMFGKPSPQGSGNGWSGWYKKWFFRSLKELSFMINYIERFKLKWESAEQHKLLIQYIGYDNIPRNYFADFIINNKYLVEIKPKNLFNSPKIIVKKIAAEKWCQEKGLKYKLIDPIRLKDNVIKFLVENNQIILTDKYKKIFNQRHNSNNEC